jgi:hypothetical protein
MLNLLNPFYGISLWANNEANNPQRDANIGGNMAWCWTRTLQLFYIYLL